MISDFISASTSASATSGLATSPPARPPSKVARRDAGLLHHSATNSNPSRDFVSHPRAIIQLSNCAPQPAHPGRKAHASSYKALISLRETESQALGPAPDSRGYHAAHETPYSALRSARNRRPDLSRGYGWRRLRGSVRGRLRGRRLR